MNADGTGPRRLTDNPAQDFDSTWSPDGSLIAFTSYRTGNYEIWVMNADGSGQRNLTNHSAYDQEPCWSR
jgi:Tol biopolymer transport system component